MSKYSQRVVDGPHRYSYRICCGNSFYNGLTQLLLAVEQGTVHISAHELDFTSTRLQLTAAWSWASSRASDLQLQLRISRYYDIHLLYCIWADTC